MGGSEDGPAPPAEPSLWHFSDGPPALDPAGAAPPGDVEMDRESVTLSPPPREPAPRRRRAMGAGKRFSRAGLSPAPSLDAGWLPPASLGGTLRNDRPLGDTTSTLRDDGGPPGPRPHTARARPATARPVSRGAAGAAAGAPPWGPSPPRARPSTALGPVRSPAQLRGILGMAPAPDPPSPPGPPAAPPVPHAAWEDFLRESSVGLECSGSDLGGPAEPAPGPPSPPPPRAPSPPRLGEEPGGGCCAPRPRAGTSPSSGGGRSSGSPSARGRCR